MAGNYPKMLFKRGDETVIFDKLNVDTMTVDNDADLAKAIADGWHDDALALNKLHYQEGGDPPTAEGGAPVDHDWAKGLEGQKGRADRFEHIDDEAKVRAEREEYVSLPRGNPPRDADPSVPPPAAETEGADKLKKNPGERTAKAEEEFAEEAAKAEEKRGRGRPRKTEEEKREDDERSNYGRNPADAARKK